ncbi:Creatinase/aminopeptidase [Melanogaster broomeanus]|nr:Creatinase/aminopeptidase [Melanogaster broomeanus]
MSSPLGRDTCLAKDHVARTFKTLVESLSGGKDKPHAVLLAGGATPYRNDTDRELPFRQESNFFYLTGCTVPDLTSWHSTTPFPPCTLTTTLYIFEPTVVDLLWSPAPPTLEEAREMYAVDKVGHPPELKTAHSQLPEGTTIHILPETEQFPSVIASEMAATKTSDHLLPALHKTRLIKDAHEIAMIRKANDISSRAHEVVMRVLGMAVTGQISKSSSGPALPGEWLIEKEAEAEAIYVASCRREGAAHQAYLPIVAASTRASTLHYCCNDRAFAWGPVNAGDAANTASFAHAHAHADECAVGEKTLLPQVLLIDAGCEWECYSSDITRTMPVGNGGKFTKEAKEVYELVLKMQSESFKLAAPGVHWDDIQLLCHRIAVEGFLDLGIFVDPDATARGTFMSSCAAFFPHGVGHSMGLDVHDVPSTSRPPGSGKYFVDGVDGGSEAEGGHKDFYKNLRLRLELVAGMVVTIEPGIYFHPTLLASYNVHSSPYLNIEVLARYEGMGGVRIEDDVLITGTGCENLTTVQSGVEWLERVCAGEDLM